MIDKNYCVYILLCDNGHYYTGYTTDLVRRYGEHLQGSLKSKYTRSFKPLKIAQSWNILSSQSIAMKIENYIKRLSRAQKEAIILNPLDLSTRLLSEPWILQRITSLNCWRSLRPNGWG
jgi:putative endonuclease